MRFKFTALMIICFVCCFAQAKKNRTASSVKREQAEVKQKINQTKTEIDTNKKRTRNQLNQLVTLNSVIQHTNANIEDLTERIDKLNKQEAILTDSIAIISQEVELLKKECKKTLRDDRKRRQNLSEISLVFSSDNFIQALKRASYIQQLNKFAADKQRRLILRHKALNDNKAALADVKKQQSELLANLSQEHKLLKEKEDQTKKLISQLQAEATTLATVLNEQQRQAAALDKELNRIIEEEARRAEAERKAQEAKRAEEARKKEEARKQAEAQKAENEKKKNKNQKDKKNDKVNKDNKENLAEAPKPESKPQTTQTPAKPVLKDTAPESAVDTKGSFLANKGKLLFPVSGRYNIVSRFGINTHKDLPGVKTENSGIDIQAEPGANARAVFDGVVSSIFYLDGYQNIIMVRHGEYLTVYANIDRILVKKGDKVKVGQQLGHIYSDPSDNNRTVLHFEVRKETQKLNPLEWVKR